MSSQISELMAMSPRALVHLRAQLHRKRLGLVFGAGASRKLSFPDWDNLVKRIASHRQVSGQALLRRLRDKHSGPPARSLASITQILFDSFRSQSIRRKRIKGALSFVQEREIRSDWLRIIHDALYRDVNLDRRKQQLERHPYLSAFRDIIKMSPLTVNYNFDDSLEKLLFYSRTSEDQLKTRGYEVTDKPNAQFQREAGIIYHPNGFLPSVFTDRASTDVVFSDDAFQDRLISAATGQYLHLSNHLFRNTCLLIGLSLDDTTLQSLLRQNAVSNPGHIHYYVHYMADRDSISNADKAIIFEANFSAFGLYTLFLANEGIRALATALSMSWAEFEQSTPGATRKFVYYIVGPIGAGKSTAIGNFRNLITYDEWIDERRADLARAEKGLSRQTIEEINEWIREQFRKKNYAVTHASEGIHFIDRSPLDPLAFGKPNERPLKAKRLLDHVTIRGESPIERGHVIYLDCDLPSARIRMSLKHQYWKQEDLEAQLRSMDAVYDKTERSIVDTNGRTSAEVAREIARVIFVHQYTPVDVGDKLQRIAKRSI